MTFRYIPNNLSLSIYIYIYVPKLLARETLGTHWAKYPVSRCRLGQRLGQARDLDNLGFV